MAKIDREREEWIRRSSQERSFLDWYTGKPHPASTGGGRRPGSRRRAPIVWVVLTLVLVPIVISIVQALVTLIFGG